MHTATHHKSRQKILNAAKLADLEKRESKAFPPLELETRSHINTEHCAWLLGRKPQTLRVWSCLENGPLRPVRINGRLAWPVAQLRQILRGA